LLLSTSDSGLLGAVRSGWKMSAIYEPGFQ
jgi:hypothetical protein